MSRGLRRLTKNALQARIETAYNKVKRSGAAKMSFSGYRGFVELNDTVILRYKNFLNAVVVEEKVRNKRGDLTDHIFQCPGGAIKVKDLVGLPYGTRVSRFFNLLIHVLLLLYLYNFFYPN